ncbi:hypothetical protein BJ138DRAFT_1091228 [Hygrophoropsis aurantiaca]|uniref:Uncharacterized protein n=1 Tax=Hygrophoropsis aurantiaca TaxID=72124 RepID=A0ACB8A612_9AGAM|nr:hypothetical protein BJ138DRAFT_1091228 [Hygrophoropsis aurantiaca]
MRFIDLPADPLLTIFLDLDVEDVLALKQSCRILNEIGSLDYLWHKLVRTCDLPLDLPLGADSATLSGQELQAIVVKALKLDHHWRKPDAYIRRVIPIIHSDTSYVDSFHLLPGGKWLVTTHHTHIIGDSDGGQCTDLTLWCLDDITSPRVIKTILIHDRATSCRAYYQPAQRTFSVAVALSKGDISGCVEVYRISLDNPAVSIRGCEPLMFHPVASDGPQESSLRIDKLRIHEDILGVIFIQLLPTGYHQLPRRMVHVYLYNLVTGASATFKAYHGSDDYFELFRDQYALARYDPPEPIVSFYDIPSFIVSANLDSEAPANNEPDPSTMSEGLFSARCSLSHDSSFSAYRGASSGIIEHGVPVFNTLMFNVWGCTGKTDRFSPPDRETRFSGYTTITSEVFHLGNNDGASHQFYYLQLGATGRRAVWVEFQGGIKFRKWSASRHYHGENPSAGVSVFMPPTTGLPFDKEDIFWIAFDEATCRLCVGLRTGELYVCDFL